MTNYIKVNYTGDKLVLLPHTAQLLSQFKPRDCPFPNYSLLDLLNDLVNMYSWKVSKDTEAAEFVEMLMKEEAHTAAYGQDIINLLKED